MSGRSYAVRAAMIELPTLPRNPACPAALPIAGASLSQQGVVCRVMERAQEEHAGTGMSAGELETLREGTGGRYLNLKSDPQTVVGFCHGCALPVLHDGDGQGRASYTYCSVWQAEKERIVAGRDELVVEPEPEPVAAGISSEDLPDPWAAAHRGLDELAPKKAA